MPDSLSLENDVLAAGYAQPAADPTEAAKIKAQEEQQKQQELNFEKANKMREQQLAMEQKALATQERGLKAEEPLRQSVLKASQDVSAAAKNRPQLEQMPAAPQKAQPDETWLSTAGLIGAIAGALTRNHATNALAAFTGVINGLSERDEAKFQASMKTWEAESKRVQDTNKNRLNAYQEILDSTKIDMDQKMVALQMEAKKWGDQATFQMAAAKQIGQIADSMDYQTVQQAKLVESRDKIAEQARQFQIREDNKKIVASMRVFGMQNTGDLEATVKAIGEGRAAPLTGIRGVPVMNLVRQRYPDFNENKFAKDRAADLAEGRKFGTMTATTESVMARAGPVIELAAEAADKVPQTPFPDLNRLFNIARDKIGDPNMANFKLRNEDLAMLLAAVNNPFSNVVTVSAQEHARELISTAASPEAYRKILETIKIQAEREGAVAGRLRAGLPIEPIKIPPLPAQSGAGGPAVGGIGSRLGTAAEQITGAPVGATENPRGEPPGAGHPFQLPDWIRNNLPEGWTAKPAQ